MDSLNRKKRVFHGWLFSLSIIVLRFINVVYVSTAHIFSFLSSLFHSMGIQNWFMQTPINEHLEISRFWLIQMKLL